MPFTVFRRSSSSSSSTASTSSSTPSSPAFSFASTSTAPSDWDVLEPVSPNGELPHLFVVERSLKAASRALPSPSSSAASHDEKHHHHHSHRPHCTLHDTPSSSSSIFSFPRDHTATICPRHNIVHSPDLAIPARDSRSASSKSSQKSRCSEGSGRSIKCALRRMKTGDVYHPSA